MAGDCVGRNSKQNISGILYLNQVLTIHYSLNNKHCVNTQLMSESDIDYNEIN